MGWKTAALTAAAFGISGVFLSVGAQNSSAIWSGVYTAAQAERGRTVVQTHCSECHHDDLSGGEGPALAGPTFMLKWETHTVERLFHKIRDTMPSRDDTDVTEQQKLDSVAFILQQNGFPAGNQELADTEGLLASLRIAPKGGVAAPRAGALVQSVGCLTEPALISGR
jgi:mono/diheme cytochrome c family protein